MTLEERITRLEDIESLRQLQARYQRCLDTRDFDGIADCFTEDVVSHYDDGHLSYQGREEVMRFLRKAMSLHMPSTHLIHGGEFAFADNEHATGKWYLEDHLEHQRFLVKLHGAAIYDVQYRKEEGRWRISQIGYQRCYQFFERRGIIDILTLSKTTFLNALRKKK